LARIGLLAAIVVILVTIAAFVASGPSRRVPPVSVAVLPNAGDAGLREFSFVQNKDGLVDWNIHAKQARVSETEAKAVLTDVTVTLTGRDGVSMSVEGDEGTINTSSKDFVIARRAGDLAVVLQDGFIIYTSHIAWANEEHRLWTDEAVRITGPRMEILGQGMDAYLENREMRVRRDVRVEVR
jgi:LPS export ABC transporter protein LptC